MVGWRDLLTLQTIANSHTENADWINSQSSDGASVKKTALVNDQLSSVSTSDSLGPVMELIPLTQSL